MKKRFKIALTLLLIIIIVLISGFLIYASDYYRADEVAMEIMADKTNLSFRNNMMILSPTIPGDTALIFYPGAKVEYTAYLPIMEKLSREGITCVLINMPLNFAIFNKNAANKVFAELPNIKKWFIGGHSLGGAMASSYAAEHKDKIKGLILLGAYIYGDVAPENALTIYGTLNSDLEKNIDYTENIIVIDGGNHAQFGNYGEQKGDLPATITSDEQQEISVKAILEFIENKSKQ